MHSNLASIPLGRLTADIDYDTDNLSWFANHLQTLKTHPHSPQVTTSLYVTTATSSHSATADSSDAEEDRRALTTHGAGAAATAAEKKPRPVVVATASSDPEKAANSSVAQRASTSTDDTGHSHGYAIRPGRPDTATLIREAVLSTPATGRVLVAACGPDGLMRTVRDVTASLIRGDGPGVELHCEQFGW